MFIFSVGIILIIYSLITSNNKSYSIPIAFLFCCVIMGFQSNVVGDFDVYQYSFENFTFNSREVEKGEYFWVILNYLFQKITSFHIFITCLSAFQCFVLVKYVNRFAGKSEYCFISALLFFFTFNYMLLQMKALRQGLAIELALSALLFIDYYIKKKHYILYAIPYSFAAFYSHHSSAILLIMVWGYFFYLIFTKKQETKNLKKPGIIMPISMAALGFVLFTIKRRFLDEFLVPYMMLLGEDRYEGYIQQLVDKEVFSPLVITYDIVVLFLLGWYYKQADYRMKYLTIAAIVGMFLDILCFANDSVQRILLYFSIFNIVVFPNIISSVSKHYGKFIAWILIIFFMGYAFKTSYFFMTDTHLDRFGNYQFFFLNN